MPWYIWVPFLIMAAIGVFFGRRKLKKFYRATAIFSEAKRNDEEEKILDEFEFALRNQLLVDGEHEVAGKALVNRKHEYRLELKERDYDVKVITRTPTVVIQFKQKTRDIELSLYIERFSGGDGEKGFLISNNYSYDAGLLPNAVSEAIEMFKVGLEVEL